MAAHLLDEDGVWCRWEEPYLLVYSGYKHTHNIFCVTVPKLGKTVDIPIPPRTTKLVEFWILSGDLKKALVLAEEVVEATAGLKVPVAEGQIRELI